MLGNLTSWHLVDCPTIPRWPRNIAQQCTSWHPPGFFTFPPQPPPPLQHQPSELGLSKWCQNDVLTSLFSEDMFCPQHLFCDVSDPIWKQYGKLLGLDGVHQLSPHGVLTDRSACKRNVRRVHQGVVVVVHQWVVLPQQCCCQGQTWACSCWRIVWAFVLGGLVAFLVGRRSDMKE